MKIEMNGKYRLRCYLGEVKIVTITSGDSNKPVVGIDRDGTAYNWAANGIFNTAGELSCLDLIDAEEELHNQKISLPIDVNSIELDVKFNTKSGYDIELVAIISNDVDLSELIKIESVRNYIKDAILNLDSWDRK